LAIKRLNDKVLTQTILVQTLVDIIINSGLVTEQELEKQIEKNIEQTTKLLESFEKMSSIEESEDEVMSTMYFGPYGEA
tara:strand:+ start:1021 stop:1257 length:237 start_codon:yes stop_codon:yes gene_type:complete